MLFDIEASDVGDVDFFTEILLKIIHKYPAQVRNGVQHQAIQVLKTVDTHFVLRRRQTKQFGLDNVRINAVNIGEGMVYDVVFGLPEEGIGPQKIEGVAQDIVDRIVVGIAAVAGIVANIKAQ